MEAQPSNTPVSEPQPTNHSSNITVISVAIFILMSLGIIAFLYHQNQQLKAMIMDYQTKMSASPTPTATVNPSANWQTYTNKSDFSFKYPANITIYSGPNNTINIGFTDAANVLKNSGGSSGTPYFMSIMYNQPLNKYFEIPFGSKIIDKQSINIGGKDASRYLYEITETQEGFNIGDKITRVIIKDRSGWTDIELQDVSQVSIFDQILSTFKFISPTPSPSNIPVSTSSAMPSGY